MLARKMVSSSGTQRPPESWSQYGLASVVHCLLVDGSGRGSCLERPVKCCRNRWSILLSNRVPMESWSQCGLASMAHLVLAGGSGWDSYDGTSPITWQGRWSVLLSHKGPRNPDVGMAWPPWCTPAGGWLRTGSHLERPDACFHNRWSILLSNRVTMESRSQCGPASMVHLVLAGGSGWDSYDGTSPITWQGRWSVLLSHKGPRNPDVGMAWPPWCTPAGGWLRTGSHLDRPDACCQNRWSILPGSGGPMEWWSQCGPASVVHLVMAGGSGRGSFHGTSTIHWQGRWSVLLGHKGPQSPGVQMAWIHGAPLLVDGSGRGSCLESPAMFCCNR
nr:uncharacterized protein LOC104650394 isoform X1 [Saimiri boliviensis boliviensis]